MGELDIFVTGMARSGTTLVEKLLANHPALSILSQPFPGLFVAGKRAFFEHLGRPTPTHPLGHLFENDLYTAAELDAFLESWTLGPDVLARLFDEMRSFSGQWTRVPDPRELIRSLHDLGPLGFAEAIRVLNRRISHRPRASGFGSKEIRCEEYLPHLLDRGFHCAVVVRDPRDVIASMNFGSGSAYVGAARPVLFDLRMWRKSVAYALRLQDHPRFRLLRYEDVVHTPRDAAHALSTWLEREPFPDEIFRSGLLDQAGRPWTGNSSHGGGQTITPRSVGRFETCLDASLLEFIETVCFPEMLALGYEPRGTEPRAEAIAGFRDRCAEREHVAADDGRYAKADVDAETRRLSAWMREEDSGDEAGLFLFREVARALRAHRPSPTGH